MNDLCKSDEANQKWNKNVANKTDAVNLFYMACLNRTADQAGLNVNQVLISSRGHHALCDSLLNSIEYSTFWGSDFVPGGGRGLNCKHGIKIKQFFFHKKIKIIWLIF